MKQLLCLGDSITDANRLFGGNPLGEGYVAHLSQKLGLQWQIRNRGVDGFTVERVYEQMEREYGRFCPDMITLLVGINDVGLMENTGRSPLQKQLMAEEFAQTYEKLILLLAERSNAPIILLEPFVFPFPAYRKGWFLQLEEISKRIQHIAVKYQLEFLPLWEQLLELAAEKGCDKVSSDGIHLTSYGHHFLATQLFDKIRSKN